MALVSPPLGATVPASPHATVVSLPTLADVEGYERKDPATLRHITVGYPRFVRNRLVGEAAARAAAALGRTGELFPLVSRVAALAWAARAGAAVSSLDEVGDWVLLTTPPGDAAAAPLLAEELIAEGQRNVDTTNDSSLGRSNAAGSMRSRMDAEVFAGPFPCSQTEK